MLFVWQREEIKIEILYNSNYFSTVKTISGDRLLSESFWVSTDFEATARLITDLRSFLIKEAQWEICRSPEGRMDGVRELPELVGVEAYFSIGETLRRVVEKDIGGGIARELLAECVKGLIQAEPHIFLARGYPSAKAYEDYWDEMYVNACRYYSNLDRIMVRWGDHIYDYQRTQNLFNRALDYRVCRQDNGYLAVSGSFSDSVHELGLFAELNGEGVIVSCEGAFLRASGPVCLENKEHLHKLTGKKIADMGKKEIGGLVGGPQGCDHLVELVHGLSRTLSAYWQMSDEK